MAGAVLFSSPSKAIRYDLHTISSSPDLPSVSELVRKNNKRPPLRSGSRAAPIPEDAIHTFTSAASVFRSSRVETIVLDSPAEEPRPRPKQAKQAIRKPRRKQVPKSIIELSPDTSASDPPETESVVNAGRVIELPKEVIPAQLSSPLSDKPWKKFKSVPDVTVKPPELTKSKVADPAAKPKRSRKKAETVSKHFATPSVETSLNEPIEIGNEEPVELQPALRRRMDWTPPPDDTAQIVSLGSPTNRDLETSQDTLVVDNASRDVFKNLHDTYASKSDLQETIIPAAAPGPTVGAKKRKAKEMIAKGDAKSAKEPSAAKTKAPKKKPRTLTELATAAYVPLSQTDVPTTEKPKPDSVLDYFPLEDGELEYQPGQPASRLRKGVKATSKPGRKKKTGPTRRNLLLSPKAALRQSLGQDFVFGTSSQLAREESPTFLRDLQAAMRASNQTGDDPFASSPPQERPAQGSGRKLWTVGARGADGDLVEIEVINLLDSPAYPKDPLADAFAEPTKATEDGGWIGTKEKIAALDAEASVMTSSTYDNETQDSASIQSILASQPQVSNSNATTASTLLISCPDTPESEPPPSNQEALEPPPLTASSSRAPVEMSRPKYDLFTDIRLAREITSYGFKPVKKRAGMIALLDQCWTSKHQAGLGGSMQTATLSSSAAASQPRKKQPEAPQKASMEAASRSRGRPRKDSGAKTAPAETTSPAKRPRGRPRKDSASSLGKAPTASMSPPPKPTGTASTPKRKKAATQVAVEIDDSDMEDLFSSPEHGLSSPSPVDLSVSEDTEVSLALSPTTEESALFTHITKAVTTAPRTQDPLKPSWHEKMLMYDPILLEDLAAWLNAGQLDRVGHEGEVSPFDLKKWCESKSVCCLWRVNLHGKERKRF